jgi:HPt (histidine-containing phosphotransfer) domain-containing protein
MKTNTLPFGRDLTSNSFWAGIVGQTVSEPLDFDQFETHSAADRLPSRSLLNIGDEIRTPLNSMIENLELLADTDLTWQQRRYVRTARASAHSLLSLVDEVANFSEIEPDDAEPEWSEFNAPRSMEYEKAPEHGPFDLANLLKRCLGDTTFCTMILHKFTARAADQLAALDRAAGSRNAAELARQAHTLTEVAASLAAGDVADSAARLERQARAGELDGLAPLLEEVHAEVARCLQAVPDVLVRMSRHG